MAVGESAGSVYVTIDGDASPLMAKYAQAEAASRAAGQSVASSFSSGAASGAAVLETFGQRGGHAFEQISNSSRKAVTDIQAVSGTLRTLDGNQGIRAAERFLTMIPGLAPALQAAFPLVGAIAFAEVVARAAEHFSKLSAGANDAANAVQRAFRELNTGTTEANDSLQVANDRLENEIAKIEKKPENGIKLALDEAILSADQLGKSLDTDLGKLLKVLTEQKTGLVGQIFGQASTSDIETEIQQFQDRVAKVNATSKITRQESFGGVSLFAPEALNAQKTAAQTQTNTELTRLYTEELQKLQQELKTAYGPGTEGAVDNTRRVELLTQAIANLREQARSIDIKGINANLQGDKAGAQAKADADRRAEEAANRALEQLHRQIEAFEAQLRAYAQAKRAQDELNAAAQKLYDTTRRLADETARVAQNLRISGVELANRSSESLSGVRAQSASERDKQETINQPALQRLQGGNDVQRQLALAIQLKQVGIETNNEVQSRIGTLEEESAAAQRLNVPIQERLKLEQQILEARIAAATANGQTDQADKLAAANVALEQTLNEWKAIDLGTAAQQIEKTLVQIPATLGSALAKGIFDHGKGQSIGKDVGQSLKQQGEQLTAKLISSSIQQLIVHMGLQTAAQAALTTVTGTHAAVTAANTVATGASVAATTGNTLTTLGNTIATEWNTIWLAVKAVFGFAGGTDSAPGGVALVGEKGPELVNLPRGSQVIPNHKIKGYADGTPNYSRSYSRSSMSIGELHVHAHGISNPGEFARQSVALIPHELKRQSSSFAPYSH